MLEIYDLSFWLARRRTTELTNLTGHTFASEESNFV